MDIRLPHTLPTPQFLALIIANAAIGAPKPKASISMCAGENAAAKPIDAEIVGEGEDWAHPPHTHPPVSPHEEGYKMKTRLGKKERRKRNVSRNMKENEGNVCK